MMHNIKKPYKLLIKMYTLFHSISIIHTLQMDKIKVVPFIILFQLGCGTGLPGLVAMKCGCDVTLSDVTDDPDYWR